MFLNDVMLETNNNMLLLDNDRYSIATYSYQEERAVANFYANAIRLIEATNATVARITPELACSIEADPSASPAADVVTPLLAVVRVFIAAPPTPRVTVEEPRMTLDCPLVIEAVTPPAAVEDGPLAVEGMSKGAKVPPKTLEVTAASGRLT